MTPVNSSSIGKIQAASKGLSPKLRAIADHIVKEPKDVVHLSIIQLAEKRKALKRRFSGCASGSVFPAIRI